MDNTNISQKYTQIACSVINVLLSVYLLVDILTGYFHLNNYPISISVPFKMVLLVLMIIVIAYDAKSIIGIWFLILHTFFCLIHIENISADPSTGINNLIKLNFCIIMYVYFRYYFSSCYLGKRDSIVFTNEIFFFINLILALLGMGYSTYSGLDVGLKGFFYAGNELGALTFCLCVFSFIKYKCKLWPILLYSGVAFLIGTKTPLFAIWIFYLLVSMFGDSKLSHKGMLFIGIALVLIYVNRTSILNIESVQFHIENLKKHEMQNDTFINSVLSGRIDFSHNLIENMSENFSLANILLGYGIPEKAAEIDPIDTLYSFGIITLIVQTAFYCIVIWISREDRVLLSFNIVYFLLSIFAGHIWFNTTSILIFCIINTCNLRLPCDEINRTVDDLNG